MAFTLVVTLCLVASLSAAKFDIKFAQKMFPLAAGAYSDDPLQCIKNHFEGYDGTRGQLFFYENRAPCDGFENDCYGYLATLTRQMAIVISFRGTNTGSQLRTELITSGHMVPMGSGKVSWYFYNAFSKVWGDDAKGVKGLERAFKDQIKKHPDYEIWVTGHSLGGAMASLAAYHIAITYKIPKRIKLVTFGEPRTGDAEYAIDFNKKIDYAFRVVNGRDPVPHVPPFKPYSHHKYEVWFKDGMDPLTKPIVCIGEEEHRKKTENVDNPGKYTLIGMSRAFCRR
ncbi:unnamed protein product [Cylicocyclus nassatus]|uniref:Fungal lipase-type domain-containing protein n=1 Tax=Cylicocyclus nassatus TaxID=53992 RepID=A0AA36H4W4_CYLNA|nr:unnamed protein product [Cylicocyclus nassatus]